MEGFFRDAPVKVKIKLLGSMFPEKIEFDGKNYRTNAYNKVLDLIFRETNKLRGNINKIEESLDTFPDSVPPAVLFSNQFLEDLDKLWELRHWIPDPTKHILPPNLAKVM